MNTPTNARILIVDDDEDDFIITSSLIKDIPSVNFHIDWCYRYKDAVQHMINKDYDIYLVDYRLGAKSGVDLLKDAFQHDVTEPVILLTGKGNHKVDLEAMQLGAFDYLIKAELNTEKLERSIRYALDRAATMKALKASENKYRSIFEKSKDIVFLTDTNLRFRDVNDAAVTMLGYKKEELLQMNLLDIIDEEEEDDLIESLNQRKEVLDLEVTLETKAGEQRFCILTATLDEEPGEEPVVQGIIHDITHLKKAEKATIQVEKLAAAGRLVRTLAHEVRNPLNNITLSVEQLIMEPDGDNGDLYLDIIQRNSKRISDLISELLQSSRPTEISLQKHHFQTILDEIVNASIDRITLKHIKLSVNYPPFPVDILADSEKLKLALLNIVINAVEAMEEQKGILEINLSIAEDEALLRISDNGCGISEENLSKLFEPYFTRKRNGLGLGLAFTLNILQSHKATIEVESTENVGTTFLITFPLADNYSADL